MKQATFDGLSRRLAAQRSRRGMLGALVGLAVGAGVATGAEARPGRRVVCRALGQKCLRNDQCCSARCDTARSTPRSRRNRCICNPGEVVCGGDCAVLDSSTDHCGACGIACPEGGICVSGVCNNAALCFPVWANDSWYCVVTTEGKVLLNPERLVHLGNVEDPRNDCASSADCQFSPMCDYEGAECYCLTDEVFGTTYDDSNHFPGNICTAHMPIGACSTIPAGFYRCSETVEGELFGSLSNNSSSGGSCITSDECNGDWDPLCDNDDYVCGCVWSSSAIPPTVGYYSSSACSRDRIIPPV